MEPENLKASFTKRYIIAISLIAILATAAFYILILALKTGDSTAFIVNKSAKQRMFSQRIASFSQQYYWQAYIKQEPSELKTIQVNLKEAIEEMRHANNALSSGDVSPKLHIELSPAIHEIYFGQTHLKKRVDEYLQLAEQIPKAPTQQEVRTLLDRLLFLSNPLLVDLNGAVHQYQKEGEENIKTIRDIETLAWALTLLTLILEVLFIFQPMANKIQELFQSVKWNEQNLEQLIELRTLSLEQANLKLSHIASHDPLTGLKNRLNLEKELEALLIHYHENHVPYCVVMLDIDWFKSINDTYGHDTGDFVLREIAKILTDNVREEDNVYRAGGEEFVILFNRITKDQALKKTNKIRLNIQEHPFLFNDHEIRLTLSGGLYHPELVDLKNVQEILKLSDIALYEAKHAGRNQIAQVKPTPSR